MRALGLITATLATSLSFPSDIEWSVAPFGSASVFMGGTEDLRFGFGVAVQRAAPAKRLTVFGWEGSLVWEGYVFTSHGGGINRFPRDVSNAFGVAGLLRYPIGSSEGFRFSIEPGFGMMYMQRPTNDLPSRLNSTPFIGLSMQLPAPDDNLRLTLRLFHASNGGTVGNNPGQNQVWVMVGSRY